MSKRNRILIVDDDAEIRDLLGRYLRRHGFVTEAARDGAAMWRRLEKGPAFELVILDLMLPGDDGLSLCRQLRASHDLAIIMLTAIGEEADRIVGLEMGADDYLPKPFNPRELLARMRAVLRRAGASAGDRPATGGTLVFGPWRLDLSRRELRQSDGVLTALTAGEFDLLRTLAEHPRRVMSREKLLDLTRGRSAGPFDRSVDVQLSRLRRKIEVDPKQPVLIKTVRTGGYVLAADVTRQ